MKLATVTVRVSAVPFKHFLLKKKNHVLYTIKIELLNQQNLTYDEKQNHTDNRLSGHFSISDAYSNAIH